MSSGIMTVTDGLWSSLDAWTQIMSLAQSESLLIVGCTSLVMHQLGRRYEPTAHASHMLAFMLLPPLLLTPLLTKHNPRIISTFITCFLTYTATLVFSTLFYRISPLHPLASYPGPIPARLSKLWMVWKSSGGKQHLYYQSLHERYGDVVRTGPNELSVRAAEAVAPVLGATGLPRGPVWDGRMNISAKPQDRSLIALRDATAHGERRKLWSKGFSTAALKDYDELIIKRGKQLLDALERLSRQDKEGRGVDMAAWSGYFTFDFMGDMAFGGGFELMQDGGDREGVWEIIENALRPTLIMSHVPWVAPFVRKLAPLNKNGLRMQAFSSKQSIKRRDEGSLMKDLWHHLFEVDNSIESLPFKRVTAEAVLAIVAGSDTTSTVLSAIWYFVCEEPSYLRRLQAEVDSAFPNFEEPFDSIKLSQMPLLNAMLNEAMRLMPATPSGAQRAVLPGTGGKTIGSHYLPEGTNVFIHTYTLHRDPRCFSPHPECFWPDRWLPTASRQYPPRLFGSAPDIASINTSFVLNNTAFIPFSFGPTGCVGKNLALQEMRIIVSLIAQKFDMRYAEGYEPSRWWEDAKDWFVWQLGKLPVVLSPRF